MPTCDMLFDLCEQIYQIFIEDICYNLKGKDITFVSKLYEFL